MSERFSLPVVDGLELPAEYRAILRPGDTMTDRHGRVRRLPRFFYEIPSWEEALETQLTEHFALWEFLNVDVWEAELLRSTWPRYVPCAVTLLAAHLELFRQEVGTYVHIAANGGYRSPAHRLSTHASTHCWGTAVNLYKIGDELLDSQGAIVKYNRIARRQMPAVYARPYGHGVGEADDHMHLDLGYVSAVPRDAPSEMRRGDTPWNEPPPRGEDDVTGAAEVSA